MWWKIYFWFLVVVMVLPFPFKLAGYALRKDPSPTLVKIEETANGVFLALGLIPLHGFIHGVQAGPATLWYAWLCIGFCGQSRACSGLQNSLTQQKFLARIKPGCSLS